MSSEALWLTIAGLGAYHGLNPAMGWLFAVSQGLQQRSRRAVWRALGPIALGHELSIALVAALTFGAAAVADPISLRIGAAAVLVGFGLLRFAKPRAHPRWTTMRVNRRELTLWSFLMSSAHGAGLMVAPLLIGLGRTRAAASPEHAELAAGAGAPLLVSGVAIALHVGAMLLVMGAVAVAVYERLGLEILRRAWLNTDQLWAATFVIAGALTLFA